MGYARKLIGGQAENTPSLVCLMTKASSTFFDSARRSIPRSFGPKLLHTRITPTVPKMYQIASATAMCEIHCCFLSSETDKARIASPAVPITGDSVNEPDNKPAA